MTLPNMSSKHEHEMIKKLKNSAAENLNKNVEKVEVILKLNN